MVCHARFSCAAIWKLDSVRILDCGRPRAKDGTQMGAQLLMVGILINLLKAFVRSVLHMRWQDIGLCALRLGLMHLRLHLWLLEL